jgi:hypothetical protein
MATTVFAIPAIVDFFKDNQVLAVSVAAFAVTFGVLDATISKDDGRCDEYRPEVRLRPWRCGFGSGNITFENGATCLWVFVDGSCLHLL